MLTDAQLLPLKAAILNETAPEFTALRDAGATGAMAEWFNLPAAPAFVVWRTAVPIDEIMANGFVWTAVDGLTAGKARIWDWMTRLGVINPSKPNIRQGLADAFGAASAMATGIMPHLKRSATRAERLFTTGTGSDAVPGLLVFEGTVGDADIVRALSA